MKSDCLLNRLFILILWVLQLYINLRTLHKIYFNANVAKLSVQVNFLGSTMLESKDMVYYLPYKFGEAKLLI